MKINFCDRFIVVVEPNDTSTLDDIMWETNMGGLERWFRGSRPMSAEREGVTIYANPNALKNATKDAEFRLARRDRNKAAAR